MTPSRSRRSERDRPVRPSPRHAARSASARSDGARAQDSPQLQGMLRQVRHLDPDRWKGGSRERRAEPVQPEACSAAQGTQARRAWPRLGQGRYSGRGIKGQKSRAGSNKMPAGFEGGQMPIDMRARQAPRQHVRGRDADRPFRTYSQPVNVGDLEQRFERRRGHARRAAGRRPRAQALGRREGARKASSRRSSP